MLRLIFLPASTRFSNPSFTPGHSAAIMLKITLSLARSPEPPPNRGREPCKAFTADTETNRRTGRVITDRLEGLMLLRLRRSALVAILASVFLLGFFAGRRSVTRGARFQQEQWAIGVAADYLQKKGIPTSGYDASAYEIYNGYRVYFAPPSLRGYARSGGDIQVIGRDRRHRHSSAARAMTAGATWGGAFCPRRWQSEAPPRIRAVE